MLEQIFSCEQPMTSDRVGIAVRLISSNFDFAKMFTLGKSTFGKKIYGLKIGKSQTEETPCILYVGAHHGMEWLTSSLLIKFADDFCTSTSGGTKEYGMQTKILSSLRTIYIIPMLNPDGVDLAINGISPDNPNYETIVKLNKGSDNTKNWQANGRGVDLNHNYNAGFNDYKELEKSREISAGASKFSGESPESEAETRALCSFIREIRPRALLTFHTQGEEIYFGNAKNDFLANYAAQVTGYKKEIPTDTAAYGGLTDWFVREFSRPAITLECGLGKNPLPHSDAEAIYRRCRRLLYTAPEVV